MFALFANIRRKKCKPHTNWITSGVQQDKTFFPLSPAVCDTLFFDLNFFFFLSLSLCSIYINSFEKEKLTRATFPFNRRVYCHTATYGPTLINTFIYLSLSPAVRDGSVGLGYVDRWMELVFSILPAREIIPRVSVSARRAEMGGDRCQIDSFICVLFHKYFDRIHSAKKYTTRPHMLHTLKKEAGAGEMEFRGQIERVFIKLSACRY